MLMTAEHLLKKIQRRSAYRFSMIIGMTFLCALFLNFFSANAHAQAETDTSTISLSEDSKSYKIGSYTYLTEDLEGKLSAKAIYERHKGNIKGIRSHRNTLNIGVAQNHHFFLVQVQNDTNQENWIFDFGNALDGRLGLASDIKVYNHNTDKTYTIDARHTHNESHKHIIGSGIPVFLEANTRTTLVVSIAASKGFPLIITPRLIEQDKFMTQTIHGKLSAKLIAGLLLIICTYFIVSLIIQRDVFSLGLLVFYASLSSIYAIINTHILDFSVLTNGGTLLFLQSFNFLGICIAVKGHLKSKELEQVLINLPIILIASAITLLSMLYLIALPQSALYINLVYSAQILAVLMLSALCYIHSKKPRKIKNIFCASILLTLIPLSYIVFSSGEVISPNIFTTIFLWLVLLGQTACFFTAHRKTAQYKKELFKKELAKKESDELAILRMQKSKEAADQARLLRVIEHERELMSELREREVKRTAEMRKAKDLADHANNAKSAFLAVVSHEIRTPMNGILGMVQLIQKTGLNKEQKEYIETIRKSGDSMMSLLNDILDFEKIEKGAMDLEEIPFNLKQVVRDVVSLMSGHAAQKSLSLTDEFDTETPDHVLGDPTRLRQVLLNLVNNAIKFTDEGSITITVRQNTDPQKPSLYFAVTDTGIGMSEEALKRLFTPFAQAETSTSRKYGGTGLGLAISNRLIEAMGGKILVESTEGEGTTFYFEINLLPTKETSSETEAITDIETPPQEIDAPAHTTEDHLSSSTGQNTGNAPTEKQESADQNQKDQAEKASKELVILVVDDNDMNRRIIQSFLEPHGHTIVMATNGFEAIEQCKDHRPDLVFMDIQMNGISGVEATVQLRQLDDKEISETPVIALTGNIHPDDINTYFKNGMNGFLAKPIQSEELFAIVKDAASGTLTQAIMLPEESSPTDTDGQDSAEESESESAQGDQQSGSTGEASEEDIFKQVTPLSFSDDEDSLTDEEQSPTRPTDNKNIQDLDLSASVGLEFDDNEDFSAPEADEQNEAHKIPEIRIDIHNTPQKKEDESSDKQVNVSPFSFGQEEEMTEIQKHLQAQEPHASGSPTTPAPAPTSKAQSVVHIEDYINISTLDNLKKSLGDDQFNELLVGFDQTAKNIIELINQAIEDQNITTLGTRGHELKGMSGNFGMQLISDIAATVEKAAKTQNNEEALTQARKLNAAYEQTQAAFKIWSGETE